MMALTRKAIVYLGLAYLFIGLTLTFREPSISVLVIPIAATFLYSSLFSKHIRPQLRIKRALNPPRSFGGESIDVKVEIQNDSSDPVDQLHLEDEIPESLSLEKGTNFLTLSLLLRERLEHHYTISAPRRGRYVLGPMSVHLDDSFGFHNYSESIAGRDQVLILPKVENLRSLELRARRVGPWPGNVLSRNVGPGTDFFELRPYSPGDDLKRINWKASAKQRRLVTNEFERERVTDVMLVIDCSDGTQSKLFEYDVEEFEVSLAASLCSQLLLQGNRVGLMVYAEERTWLAPAFGKRQLLRILSGLAIVRAGSPVVPIGYAVETIATTVLPARSVVIFVSPFVGDGIVDAVLDTANAGYNVMCFAPTASTTDNGSGRQSLARKILATERRMNVKRIIPVSQLVSVAPNTSLQMLLRRIKPWIPV
jgi:uncharacterized protein (DUF58 family)